MPQLLPWNLQTCRRSILCISVQLWCQNFHILHVSCPVSGMWTNQKCIINMKEHKKEKTNWHLVILLL
jgi:hypothetical protein